MTVVDEYLAQLEGPAKQTIEHMHQVIRKKIPGCEEGLSYGMPAFKYKGKGVIAIMVLHKHLSLYPFSGQVISRLEADLKPFTCTAGSIHFSSNKPIDDACLEKILQARIAQIDAK